MSEERRRILEMLSQGKIDVEDAERLLGAVGGACVSGVGEERGSTHASGKGKPRYLRVLVEDKDDRVDVRVPLQLMRAGIKLASLIPKDAQVKVNAALSEKGVRFDLSDLDPETLEQLIESMGDLDVNVAEGEQTKVRVFCE